MLTNDQGLAFQPNPNLIIPPHLQWLYGNQQPGNHFGYGKGSGTRSSTVTGLTQNAGSEKKDPSSGSYNYIDVMRELDKQCRLNDVISVKEKSTSKNLIENNVKNTQVATIPAHLKFDSSKLEATVLDYCDRNDVGLQLDELLVIEYYSRR